jgi:RHS repeat-associated protein
MNSKEPTKIEPVKDEHYSPPSVSLPKGGGAIKGIGEKFAANPVTGTGSFSIPLPLSPGRSGFTPALSLSYDSGSGNGPFGFGWSVGYPSITRRTDKGLPQYLDDEGSDVFILSGAEDLVPDVNQDTEPRNGYRVTRYRPRIEGLFARIERWSKLNSPLDTYWRSISRDNVTTFYGKTSNSRIADPGDPSRIFSWLICQSYDDKGNAVIYEYQEEDSDGVVQSQVHEKNRTAESRGANRYLKRVKYGNRIPNRVIDDTWLAIDPTQLPDETWMFELVFDYGEGHYSEAEPDAQKRIFARAQLHPSEEGHWPVREDPFSSYRAGFEVRTYRFCQRVLMFHHFPLELGTSDYLVRSTEFTYNSGPIACFITEATQSGYVRQLDSTYLKRSFPPLNLEYSKAEIRKEIETIDAESLENLPIGVDGLQYQWLDLDGEGLQGVLSEQPGAWYYKRNLSPISFVQENGKEKVVARFAPLAEIETSPSIAGGAGGRHQFLDLAGDGSLDLVQFEKPVAGFFERTDDEQWESFIPFASLPNLSWNDPNLKFIDLTGDGHVDILLTEDQALIWYPSLAEQGFEKAIRIPTPLDEEKGPAVVFADGTQAVVVADLSGDGLTDIVRIRNGEICYWPNLGYGCFGARVTMDNAPWFDAPDQFDQKRIRLADIDGSGTTDIIYLERHRVAIYRNECGNAWSTVEYLENFPPVDDLASVTAVDLLGVGTACLVWSSPLPGNARRQMRYIDLMGGQKPHLLTHVTNNLGAETVVEYAPSTKFYLADKLAGKPWITRLPFPVHVVERVVTHDLISRNRFVTRYNYHHGYFDGFEREFRGFGMVEQRDTEEFAVFNHDQQLSHASNNDPASHVPPVRTRTWFHTGAYLDRDRVSTFFAGEYYREPGLTDTLLDDTILPPDLTADEEREACRALKGAMLRQEVYALDGSEKEPYPYSVTEQNFTVRLVQPKGTNPHAVFFTQARESISYHYERNPSDPRIGHSLTLEVDNFGNVLKSLTIGYGRRTASTDPALTDDDKNKQTRLLITYAENDFTEPPLDEPDHHRTPLPAEARTYELTGFKPENNAARFSYHKWTRDNFDWLVTATEIRYEQTPDNVTHEKRLIEDVRTLYRKDDLTGFFLRGRVGKLALPGESYKLALTPELVAHVFKRTSQPDEPLLPTPEPLLEGKGADKGGYTAFEGSWWIPSGRLFFDPDTNIADPASTATQELKEAREHFFLPRKFANPFDQEVVVDNDDHDLVAVRTEDALKNVVSAQLNYRTLQPELVIDANRNRVAATFDALGLVVATAVMGREGELVGDRLEDVDADPPLAELQAFVADPETRAAGLLGKSTTRIVYDLNRFQRIGQPSFAAMLARETHFHDPGGPETNIQSGFTYSDGFGREIQQKIQAEDGEAPQRQPDVQLPSGDVRAGELVHDANGNPVLTNTSHRWVGTGRTVFNNKGKPIRQYEPFFSATHLCEEEREMTDTGVSSALFYDPIVRIVATLHPNNTYEKVVFDPWQQTTYDVNDTVVASGEQTGDPRTDDDISEYVREYFKIQPTNWQTWHAQRINQPAGSHERDAAEKAAAHGDTPTVAHLDVLGRPFLTLADNGPDPAQPGKHLKFATRVETDIEGNQRDLIDAKDRVVMRYDYDMLGSRLHQASMEAGERWTLNDVTGNPIRAWDSRSHIFRTEYDALRRATKSFVTGDNPENPGHEICFHVTVYGEKARNAEPGLNLRGKPLLQCDGAGAGLSGGAIPETNREEAYDFKNNPLRTTRRTAREYKKTVDWNMVDWSGLEAALSAAEFKLAQLFESISPMLETESFTSAVTYDAHNRPITSTAPDNSVYRPTFNKANLLDKVHVNLRGGQTVTPFVTNINYNAKGQRELITYENGVQTGYEYDPLTFRLIKLKTARPNGLNGLASKIFIEPAVVQDLRYTYDPAGNITRIEDRALKTIFHDGPVSPVCEYTYDATYRLIEAKGREHIGQTAFNFDPPDRNRRDYPFAGLNHPNDLQAMRNYTETYQYNAVGNFEFMHHIPNDGGEGRWKLYYDYEEVSLIDGEQKSNRLTRTRLGNGVNHIETYTYRDSVGQDGQGCMTSINSMKMKWDFKDQLQQVNLDGGGTAYYVYDASGQRVRKVIETQNSARQKERIYLGGFERYREFQDNGANVKLERETLHVMDDKQRIALVETKTIDNGNTINPPDRLIRYQLSNHLGSSSVELNDQAQLISYEEYHPYGTSSFQAAQGAAEVSLKRYRYTGMERDEETGLAYHSARFYAPWLGRWVSSDPQGITGGINLYRYSDCDPVGLLDPNGLQPSAGPTEKDFEEFNVKIDTNRDHTITAQELGSGLLCQTTITAGPWFEYMEGGLPRSGYLMHSELKELADRSLTVRGKRMAEQVMKEYEEHQTDLQMNSGGMTFTERGSLEAAKRELSSERYLEKGITMAKVGASVLLPEYYFLASSIYQSAQGNPKEAVVDLAAVVVGRAVSGAASETEAATLARESPAPIHGRAQRTGTPGHDVEAAAAANELANEPGIGSVHLNRPYRSVADGATNSRRAADVMTVSHDGKILGVEVPSRTDRLIAKSTAPSSKSRAIINRNLKVHRELGDKSEGLFIIGANPEQSQQLMRVIQRALRKGRPR